MSIAGAMRFGCLQFAEQNRFAVSLKKLSTVFCVPKVSPKTELWNEAILKGLELVDKNGSVGNVEKTLDFMDASIQRHLLKTAGTKHPVLNVIKNVVYGNRVHPKLFGNISLLLAKAVGHTCNSPNYEDALANEGISSRQRKLADALELYRASFIIHTNILNLPLDDDGGQISKSLKQANDLSVLGGDLIAANAYVTLTSIRENKVLELVAEGLSNFTESFFHWETDKNGNPLPDPEKALEVWEHATSLEHASLLAQGCEAMTVLSGHSEDVGKVAGTIGRNIAMAIKMNNDMQDFEDISNYRTGTPFNVVLLPVIMHLESDRQLLDEIRSKGKKDITNLDFQKIYSSVQEGNGMKEASNLVTKYIKTAEENLITLGSSKSVEVLRKMLSSL